jgi:iron uptake system EfeUOB component EfeO/EfeM
MKKLISSVGVLILLVVFGVTGCGTTSTPTPNKTESGQASATQTTQNSDQAMKDGISKLLHTAKQLNKAIAAGDENKVKETGPKLEEIWKTCEDAVKAKYPALYSSVEQYLDPTVAGTKASPIDKETLSKLDNQLIQVLYSLSEKVISVEQVKAGAEKLLATAKDLKVSIDAGDQATVKQKGPQLEETWSTFEDGVKPRSAELYNKIETALNPEVAGAQASSLDKQTMGNLNDQLIQALNELLQKLQ